MIYNFYLSKIVLSKNCVIACVLEKKYLKVFVSFRKFVKCNIDE